MLSLSTLLNSKFSLFTAVTYAGMSTFAATSPAFAAGSSHAKEEGASDGADALHGAHGAGGYDASHEVEGLPQLDFTTYTPQLFWMAVLFFVLYVFFAKKTLPEISNVVEKRKNHIDGYLKDAEELTAKSDKVQAAYKEKLSQAQADAMAAVKTVEDEAKAKVDSYMQSFQKRAEEELTDAEARIEKAKEKVMSEMDDIVSQTSSIAVEKIIGQAPKANKKAA